MALFLWLMAFFSPGVVQAFRPARNGGPEGPHYTWVKTLEWLES
jgi:hypothetical protein